MSAGIGKIIQRYRFVALLLIPFLLGVYWAFATPPPVNGTALALAWGNFHPDEGSHISVVNYMAAHPFSLPPYRSPYDTSIHPPLYHGLAGMVVRFAAPVLGDTGALRLVRVLGVLMGLGTVWFTYRAARQTRFARTVALPAAILVALIPMRVSLSGGITNENGAALGAAATLAFLFECVRYGFTGRRFAWLVFWCVVAVGCKITCAGLVLAIGAGLLLGGKRDAGWGLPIARFAVLCAALGVCLGWWFVYNTVHYGDPLRKAAADRIWDAVQPGYAVLGVARGYAPWRYLVGILGTGWVSFWGCFDGMTRRFPLFVYLFLSLLQLAAFVGAGFALRRILPRSPAEQAIGIVTGVFTAWVLLVFVQYNWAHYTPQGRYFFVLLAPFGILMAGGINGLLGSLRASRQGRGVVWAGIATFLLLLNVYAAWVMPHRLP